MRFPVAPIIDPRLCPAGPRLRFAATVLALTFAASPVSITMPPSSRAQAAPVPPPLPATASAQDPPPLMQAVRAGSPINVDGVLDEDQ